MPKPAPDRLRGGHVQERRFLSNRVEVRRDGDADRIIGYGAVFNRLSDDVGGFRERIAVNAFDRHLATNPDVRGLFNHDTNLPLGRTASGTLRLSVDSFGLRYEIDPPDTTYARDLIVSMRRGDVNQSSFAFICVADEWTQEQSGQIIRTILEAELLDVSPVTVPAYPDATSGIRASLRSCPAELRSKIRRSADDDDIDCDPDSPDYDPQDDDCDSSEDRCDCRCEQCRDGLCEQCSNVNCSSMSCGACPVQEREANIALLLRLLRK